MGKKASTLRLVREQNERVVPGQVVEFAGTELVVRAVDDAGKVLLADGWRMHKRCVGGVVSGRLVHVQIAPKAEVHAIMRRENDLRARLEAARLHAEVARLQVGERALMDANEERRRAKLAFEDARRDDIERWLRDGKSYAQIVRRLGGKGAGWSKTRVCEAATRWKRAK